MTCVRSSLRAITPRYDSHDLPFCMRETRCQSDANLMRESVAFINKKRRIACDVCCYPVCCFIVSLQIKCVAVCGYADNSIALWPRLRWCLRTLHVAFVVHLSSRRASSPLIDINSFFYRPCQSLANVRFWAKRVRILIFACSRSLHIASHYSLQRVS